MSTLGRVRFSRGFTVRCLLAATVSLVASCGYLARPAAGPTITSEGKVGVEASVDVGGYYLALGDAAASVGLHVETMLLQNGEMALFLGLAMAAELVPPNHTGGHLGVAVGGVVDDANPGTGFRVALGVSRVTGLADHPGGGGLCNDKGDCMVNSRHRALRQLGIAAAWSGVFVDDNPDDDEESSRLSRPWRLSLLGFWERSTVDAY